MSIDVVSTSCFSGQSDRIHIRGASTNLAHRVLDSKANHYTIMSQDAAGSIDRLGGQAVVWQKYDSK